MQAVREESAAQERNIFALWWNKLTVPQMGMVAAVLVVMLSMVSIIDKPDNTSSEVAALEDALDSFASFSNEEVSSWGEDPFL